MGMSFNISIGDIVKTPNYYGEIIYIPEIYDDESYITIVSYRDNKKYQVRVGNIQNFVYRRNV